MDIRTKLIFAFVAVSIVSMATIGAFTVRAVGTELDRNTREQLNGLASFKEEAVAQVVAGWKERVALVASRTMMRATLADRVRGSGGAATGTIDRFLQDALEASPLFVGLWVHDRDGVLLGQAGTADADGVFGGLIPEGAEPSDDAIRYNGLAFRESGAPVAGFTAPLEYEGQRVGYLHALISTEEIRELSDNYEGLGETGETIVFAEDARGTLRTLHPVRFPPEGAEDSGIVLPRDRAAALALAEDEGRTVFEYPDYRGLRVHVASTYLPETEWGVAVKIDAEELQAPIVDFRSSITQLAVTLGAFAILVAFFLGLRFAQPIHKLAETAGKLAAGELDARSGLQQEDEIGLLSRTFDQMADSLEEKVELLTEFRRFFDVSIDMMCIASTDGHFKRVNRACIREFGWSEEELLSRPFISFVHPDDHRATAREIQKLARGTPTIRFTNRFLCTDGSFKRVRWNAYPEAETGRLYAIARVRSQQPDHPPEAFPVAAGEYEVAEGGAADDAADEATVGGSSATEAS